MRGHIVKLPWAGFEKYSISMATSAISRMLSKEMTERSKVAGSAVPACSDDEVERG